MDGFQSKPSSFSISVQVVTGVTIASRAFFLHCAIKSKEFLINDGPLYSSFSGHVYFSAMDRDVCVCVCVCPKHRLLP